MALNLLLNQRDAVTHGQLGWFLDDVFDGATVVLHDRKVPDASGTIDHIVIASSGVWLIDAKGFWGLQSRDHDKLAALSTNTQAAMVESFLKQSHDVCAIIEPMCMGGVPVHPVVCVTDFEWSQRSKADVVDDTLVLSPDKLRSVASQPGWIPSEAITAIANQLRADLPASVLC